MKNIKKLLSVIICVVMVFSAMPITNGLLASAATSGTTGDCTWTLNDKTLIISGNGAMADYDDYFSTLPWGTSITKVEIKDGVTSIGPCSFYDCKSLTSVTIGDSVTSIGYSAFYNTAYYNDSSNWEDNVLYIGNHLIKAKTSISGSYTIKSGTKTIADSAFYGCENLTSVTIPDSVTSIGNSAFYDCTSLTSITIPDSVESLGDSTFSWCTSLTSVTIGDSVTSIGNSAFEYCTSLTSITIPESVKFIDFYTFNNCGSLNEVLYCGTEEDWGKITIDNGNPFLISAKKYFKNLGSGEIGENAEWEIDFSGKLIISGSGVMDNYKLSSYAPWYNNFSRVKEIEIGEGITKVGNLNFDCLTNVSKVLIFNPDLHFGMFVFNENTEAVIYANGGGNVQNYAIENNIKFKNFTQLENTLKPRIYSIENNVVKLLEIDGYEYSLDGETWQQSNVFEVNYDTKLDFYQRIISSDKKSSALKVYLVSPPEVTTTNTSIEIKALAGYEYCLDDMIWTDNNQFKRLITGETYTAFQRPKDFDSQYTLYLGGGSTVILGENNLYTATTLTWLKKILFNMDDTYNPDADFNGDSNVDILDSVVLKNMLLA